MSKNFWFRFHTGSIKRTQERLIQQTKDCFDSILVRLKVVITVTGVKFTIVSIPYWFD